MNHFRTMLLLSLAAAGCGGTTNADTVGNSAAGNSARIDAVNDTVITPSADVLETTTGAAGAGGSEIVNSGGASGDDQGQGGTAAGDTSVAGSDSGGSAGAGDQGGTGGVGGSSETEQGGSAGEAGSASQGGTGGTAEGGTGGSSATPPPPACDFDLEHNGEGTRCTDLLFESCTLVDGVVQYESTQCGTGVGSMNCDPEGACNGDCSNGDIRCTGDTAEACVSGAWEATEVCGFQCVDGACEGACTPGDVLCDGASVVTCGNDFHYGNPDACSGDVNATATCSDVGECGTTCTPGFADCTAASGCESDLSNVDSCGGCGIVCPGAPNATRTCNGGVCGVAPIACSPGTADCGGDWTCETNTASDPLNCGGCGVRCYGTCDSGVCDVETVADFTPGNTTFDSVIDLVSDGSYVYWWTYDRGANAILRAPKTGGAPETLTSFTIDYMVESLSPRDNALLVDNGQLYWARSSGIFRMAVTGGAVTKISNQGAAGLVIDGGKLYWNNASTTNTPSCRDRFYQNQTSFLNCNNGAVVTFYTINLTTLVQTSWQTTQYEFSHVLGVQGNELFVARFQGYFATGNANYSTSILVLNAATGIATRVVTDMARIDDIEWGLGESFGQAVFTGGTVVFTTERGIYQTPSTSYGEASQVKAYGTFVSPEFIAADANDVYFSNPGHSMSRVSRSTLATKDIFGSPGNNTSKVAVDASYVYWSVDVNGERVILRTAK